MNTQLTQFLASQGFTPETILYRYSFPEYIAELEDGSKIINANPSATEMIEDIYNSGHIFKASELGMGLSFTTEIEKSFKTDEHVLISVRICDIIDQEGMIYPDKSTYTLNAFYLTMPEGFVKVELKS
jgi:hypothetical protein